MDEFKEKVKSTIDAVTEKTKDMAARTSETAKNYARIAKLSLEINSEKDVVKKAYSEIGKLYYNTYKDEAQGFFVQLCDEVTMALDSINAKELEITELKSGLKDSGDFDVEIEEDDDCDCCCSVEAGDETSPEEETAGTDDSAEAEGADAQACDCGCEEHSQVKEDENTGGTQE